MPKYKISFVYVEKVDKEKRLRVKERIVEAESYDDAVWEVRREFLAKGIEVKLYRRPEKV
jgi:hypothetical protein